MGHRLLHALAAGGADLPRQRARFPVPHRPTLSISASAASVACGSAPRFLDLFASGIALHRASVALALALAGRTSARGAASSIGTIGGSVSSAPARAAPRRDVGRAPVGLVDGRLSFGDPVADAK